MAPCLSPADRIAAVFRRAQKCTVRRAEPGRSLAVSKPSVAITRRPYYQTVWSSLQAELMAALWRARNCMIRRAGPGLPPATLTLHVICILRHCYRTVRSLLLG